MSLRAKRLAELTPDAVELGVESDIRETLSKGIKRRTGCGGTNGLPF